MTSTSKPTTALGPGKEQAEAMLNMQKELLDAYQQASVAWLSRVKSEVDLWSELAAKLIATRTIPEALTAYQKYVAQRMQMAAEDGERISSECQKMTQRITLPLSNGWPRGSS